MKISLARESLASFLLDAEPLLEAHWQEVHILSDKNPLSLDLGTLHALEGAGALRIFCVRSGGERVGYSCHAITRHLLADLKQASQLAFYVVPAARRAGVGTALLSFASKQLATEGVAVSFQSFSSAAFDDTLAKLQYYLCDRTFARVF